MVKIAHGIPGLVIAEVPDMNNFIGKLKTGEAEDVCRSLGATI